uniref:Uncharacterized protein MANES_01G179900 n=1 Tax=Rhizophora mucronata TaxID=61149 RepID=A0A2P2KKB0_RHIMU
MIMQVVILEMLVAWTIHLQKVGRHFDISFLLRMRVLMILKFPDTYHKMELLCLRFPWVQLAWDISHQDI